MRWMQTVTAVGLAVSLTTGCVRGDGRYVAYAGEVLLVGAGVHMIAADQLGDHEAPTGVIGTPTIGYVLAAVGIVGFGATYLTNADDPVAPPPPSR